METHQTPTYPSTFDGLLSLVARLRGEDGCPWDREQTRDSMKRYVLEECYELLDAMDEGDAAMLADELGDVLFHVAFQVQLGVEEGTLTDEQVFRAAIQKLIRRHPHVFGDTSAADARDVESSWHAIKRAERAGSGASALDGVSRRMPALAYAQAIQDRAARTGFDWQDVTGVLSKVGEELEELQQAESQARREAELGDVLFSVVNLSRWFGVDAETALRKADARFRDRFVWMEQISQRRDLSFDGLTPAEKDALWDEAKREVG